MTMAEPEQPHFDVGKHVAVVSAMAPEATQHKVECASASLSDDEATPSSPARSPDSHTTNIGRDALSNGAPVPLQQGDYTSPTTSTSGADATVPATGQPSALSEVTAHLLAAQTSTAAAQLAAPCNRSTAASPACDAVPPEETPPDEWQAVPRQPRTKRARRDVVAPLVEVLLTLDPSSATAPPPLTVNGARLAPHIASKVAAHSASTTHLRHGCTSLQRTDMAQDTRRPSARLASTPCPSAAACDRAREFCPGEPSPNTLSRACRFLLQQDDFCNAAALAVERTTSTTSMVVSDMRHQHRHGAVDGEPVPMQFIEHVLKECETWMAP